MVPDHVFYRYTNFEDLTIIDPSYGNYNVYQINKQGNISSRYYFNFGKNAYTKKEIPILIEVMPFKLMKN